MAEPEVRTVLAEPLDSEGWQPVRPGHRGRRLSCWSCGAAPSSTSTSSATTWKPLRCDHLNRHHTATQALIPLDGAPAVVVVAPAEVDFSAAGDLDAIRAFIISGAQGINLAIATWHWGPYPLGPEVHLANVQGRVEDDNEVAHLGRDLGVVIEVRV